LVKIDTLWIVNAVGSVSQKGSTKKGNATLYQYPPSFPAVLCRHLPVPYPKMSHSMGHVVCRNDCSPGSSRRRTDGILWTHQDIFKSCRLSRNERPGRTTSSHPVLCRHLPVPYPKMSHSMGHVIRRNDCSPGTSRRRTDGILWSHQDIFKSCPLSRNERPGRTTSSHPGSSQALGSPPLSLWALDCSEHGRQQPNTA